ncbi:hypothetical protein NSTC745_02923 [Nostoc sp. DSM 114161]|jgi:hypothetical protein
MPARLLVLILSPSSNQESDVYDGLRLRTLGKLEVRQPHFEEFGGLHRPCKSFCLPCKTFCLDVSVYRAGCKSFRLPCKTFCLSCKTLCLDVSVYRAGCKSFRLPCKSFSFDLMANRLRLHQFLPPLIPPWKGGKQEYLVPSPLQG